MIDDRIAICLDNGGMVVGYFFASEVPRAGDIITVEEASLMERTKTDWTVAIAPRTWRTVDGVLRTVFVPVVEGKKV